MLRPAVVVAAVSCAVLAGVALAAGGPAAGKKPFQSRGCGGCHTFEAAGTTGKIGPALTNAALAADAKRARQSLTAFVRTPLVKPDAYVAKGYRKGVMPSSARLTKRLLDDLVAFVAKG